jgi:hypothetical protein
VKATRLARDRVVAEASKGCGGREIDLVAEVVHLEAQSRGVGTGSMPVR